MSAQTAFGIHAAAYWAARGAYEKHREQCLPSSDDALMHDYEAAYTPLVAAMHDAAIAAVEASASTTAEIFQKIEIFLTESLHHDEREAVGQLIGCIGRDAARIGGTA
jgi:hypothetical protein